MTFLLETHEQDMSSAVSLHPKEQRVYEELIDHNAPAKHLVFTNSFVDAVKIYVKLALRWISVRLDHSKENPDPIYTTVGYFTRSDYNTRCFIKTLRNVLRKRYCVSVLEEEEADDSLFVLHVKENCFVFRAMCFHDKPDNPFFCNLAILDLPVEANPLVILEIIEESDSVIGLLDVHDEKTKWLAKKMYRRLKDTSYVDWNCEIIEKLDHIEVMKIIAGNATEMMNKLIVSEKIELNRKKMKL